MPWLLLLLAGALESCWPIALKYGANSTKLWPTAVAIAGSAVSFGLLWLAMKSIPTGTSYAVWTGIGITGTTTLGIMYLGDTASPLRLGCIVLILIGVVGLRITSTQ